ncbi:hypothetical protein DEO72_LG6g670 [Vigna unguiculata]|uniref:Uncharacterized protein n=1 Tax=Vigna unguiculata TaxID=3917 RepID=A0A4D6M3Z9_VIGUN|nr:hypothetical protein DEO72_LG6g669 [Vigna unguiculata]QCD95972.1 hypothetical protein DEO72_LG6g670 [Vigna unguiculata]
MGRGLCDLDVRGLQSFGWYLKGRLAGVFFELWLVMVSLELWLGIEGKHVAFFELWLRMTSFKLWLKIEDGHGIFLEFWLRIVCVTNVSVLVVARTKGLHSIKQS